MRESRNHRRKLIGVTMLALLIGVATCVRGTNAADQKPEASAATAQHEEHDAKANGHGDGDQRDFSQPPLQFELPMFIYTLVLFGAFILFMRPTVWEPLIQALGAREGRIAQAEADAEATRKEVANLVHQTEVRLAEVQRQVADMLAKARVDAEAQKREITAKAESEAQRIRQTAMDEISRAKDAALQQLDQASGEQVALATEHLAGVRF